MNKHLNILQCHDLLFDILVFGARPGAAQDVLSFHGYIALHILAFLQFIGQSHHHQIPNHILQHNLLYYR